MPNKPLATEADKVALNKSRAEGAKQMPSRTPDDIASRTAFVMRQGKDEAASGGKVNKEDADKLDINAKNVGAIGSGGYVPPGPDSHRKGGRIAHDGIIMAHKDEEVLPKKDANDYRAFRSNAMSDALGALGGQVGQTMGSKEPVDKKELHIRKGASGGYIVKHVSADSANMPEEHVAKDMDSLKDHMEKHLGEGQEDNG